MRRPPTLEWYKLHRIATGKGNWTADIISWGLNVAKPSFVEMQRDLIQAEAMLPSGKSREETAEHKQTKHPPVFAPIEVPYGLMELRFRDAPIPESLWYKTAISEISIRCEIAAKEMLREGFYNKSDGNITDKGENLWEKRLAKASEPSILNSAVATGSKRRMRSSEKSEAGPKRRKFLSSASSNRALDDIEDEKDAISGSPSKEDGVTLTQLSKQQTRGSALAASSQDHGSLPLENTQHARSGTTPANTDFSVMVAFGPPNHSSDDTDAWEQYLKKTVLDKRNQYPCLKNYTWMQEKPGWGKFVHAGQRDAHRLGAITALRGLLKNRGFNESCNQRGGIRFDPLKQNPPGQRI